MQQKKQSDTLEILVCDLILKLGKAHQQLEHLTNRVALLEEILQTKSILPFNLDQKDNILQ